MTQIIINVDSTLWGRYKKKVTKYMRDVKQKDLKEKFEKILREDLQKEGIRPTVNKK
jgi:hypothetical protein